MPHAASVYLTHSWNGYVQGLKAVPASDRPDVPIVFFAFRIMVGVGLLLFALVIASLVLRWKGRLYTSRWFQLACMLAVPLGFVAVLAGWTVTETAGSHSSSTDCCVQPMLSRQSRPVSCSRRYSCSSSSTTCCSSLCSGMARASS